MRVSRPFILGSRSPFRRRILDQLGYTYEVRSPDIDEKAIRHPIPSQLVLLLTEAKSKALRQFGDLGDSLLITADQVVVSGGAIREKPQSAQEARFFLESYREQPAETISALGIFDPRTQRYLAGVETAKIFFKDITDHVIDGAIADGTIFSCSGGFAIEHPILAPCIARIEGTEDSVQGLPISLLQQLLQAITP
jgi:septum formation protein